MTLLNVLGSTAFIGWPLFGWPGLSLSSSIGALLAYAANSIPPQLVADFKDGVYGKNSALSTFHNVLNHVRNSNATMVDSDGLLKWAPHNLAKHLSELSAQNGTLTLLPLEENPDGGVGDVYRLQLPASSSTFFNLGANTADQHTVGVFVKKNAVEPRFTIANNNASGSDLISTDEWAFFSKSGAGTGVNGIANGNDSYAVDILVWRPRFYRSDLGGMVNNPATGDSYVPTTDAARFLPRENHHVYNGSSWVKEGYLHEPETATNLLTYSQDFSQWSAPAMATSGQTNSLTGQSDATLIETIGGVNKTNFAIVNALENIETSFSIIAKAGTADWLLLYDDDYSNSAAWFNLASGTVGTLSSNLTANIEDLGGGWRRCSLKLKNPDNYTPRLAIEVVTADGDSGATNGENIYVYGAQFEVGSVPTSYIPTSGSTVTRATDTLTLPVANIPYPEPVYIGPELSTDTFDTVSGYDNLTTSISFSSFSTVGNGSQTRVFVTFPTVIGEVYRFTNTQDSGDNTTVFIREGNTGGGTILQSADGGETQIFVATATDTSVLWLSGDDNSFAFSGVSVREINPLAVSFGYKSLLTYADENLTNQMFFMEWNNITDYVRHSLDTDNGTGYLDFDQRESNNFDRTIGGDVNGLTPGINVPISYGARHGSTFINAAIDGTSRTANAAPTGFPDLSATDLIIAPSGGPQIIQEFVMWGGTTGDIGDAGIAETSA